MHFIIFSFSFMHDFVYSAKLFTFFVDFLREMGSFLFCYSYCLFHFKSNLFLVRISVYPNSFFILILSRMALLACRECVDINMEGCLLEWST